MEIEIMKNLRAIAILGLSVIAVPAFADDDRNFTTVCPSDVAIAIDSEFGPGSADVTRCLAKRHYVKVVYQINQLCKDSSCSAAYAIGNIGNAVKDYENTHGMVPDQDYEIVAIVHSAGWKLVLDNVDPALGTTNPFRQTMVELLEKGVKVKFCQNTARSKGVTLDKMIDGIEFVTSGVTAIADYQSRGYAFVQP